MDRTDDTDTDTLGQKTMGDTCYEVMGDNKVYRGLMHGKELTYSLCMDRTNDTDTDRLLQEAVAANKVQPECHGSNILHVLSMSLRVRDLNPDTGI